MEVDHLIPKSLAGSHLRKVLDLHGLPPDYDLYATRNLAPACRPCNELKSKRPPPSSPVIALLLEDGVRLAPVIEVSARKIKTGRGVSQAIALIMAADPEHLDQGVILALRGAIATIERAIGAPTGSVRLHPAIGHDYEPPETHDASSIISVDTFLGLLREWIGTDFGHDTLPGAFNGDDQELASGWPTAVDRLEYADKTGSFLSRVTFDIAYTYFDADGVGGPANVFDTFDFWVDLDEARTSVTDVVVAPRGAFPD